MREVRLLQVQFLYQTFNSMFELEEPMTIKEFLDGGFTPLRRQWGVRWDWVPWVNGVEVDETYVLQDGDLLEYLKPANWTAPQRPAPAPVPTLWQRIWSFLERKI